MLYCGRENVIIPSLSGGRLTEKQTSCEFNNFVNCPACRVFKSVMTEKITKADKWIGYSGLIYCGKEDCKVDEGKNCEDCWKMMNK
jgi:hypothetical protein